MDIAMFTESYSEDLDGKRRQVLITPHDSNVRVYSRLTDGTKGPHNKWEETTLDELTTEIQDEEILTRTPVGVYVTPPDQRAMTSKGYSPVLGTKACDKHSKAEPTTDTTPLVEVLCNFYEQISMGDDSLETYVTDNRASTSTTVPLVVTVPTQTNEDAAPVQSATSNTFAVSLATVPPKYLADRYIHRKVYGVEDFKTFDKARKDHINVLIYGPTGPGKTTAVEAWAAARGLRMATVSGNASMESRQLFGGFIPDGQGGYGWIDGPVTDVVRNGGVLLLDEMNFISPKIYTTLYPLTDGRRSITLLDHMGETIVAHEDLTIFATMNPDYIGTTPLNFAMRNRFDIQLSWDYDDAVEAKLVSSKSLLLLVKQLRAEAAKGQYETPISTNMLMEIEDFIKDEDLGYEFAVENFIAHFSADEQASVRLVFQTHEHNIKSDFGIEVPVELEKEADVDIDTQLSQWVSAQSTTV
jgi:Holliday junction resolvasome RuvABC ATP-dependent DNA helicase subunit